MKENINESDMVIRIGGDEFLVVMRDCEKKDLEQKAKSLKNKIQNCNGEGLDGCSLAINVGTSYTDNFNCTKEQCIELYKEADYQMYKDKNEDNLK